MTKFINFVSLKGSIVLSAKESILSRSSHHKSERIFVFLSLVFLLVFGSCSEDNSDNLVTNKPTNKHLISADSTQHQYAARPSDAPVGWTRINGVSGIARFEKRASWGRKWHVIKVWLPMMRISPIYQHPLSGDDPIMAKKTIFDWFNTGKLENSLASFNASFFIRNENLEDHETGSLESSLTWVSHAFGQWNRTLSYGHDSNEANQMTFYIQNQRAHIERKVLPSKFETYVNGLNPYRVNKSKMFPLGRTMIGIPKNGSRAVYIFVAGRGGRATQSEALRALRDDFQCEKFVMLDGSGSSMASWKNSVLVKSTDSGKGRAVPVLLGVYKR